MTTTRTRRALAKGRYSMKPATLHRIMRGATWAAAFGALHQVSQLPEEATGGRALGVALAVACIAHLWTTEPKRNTRRKGRKS